MTNKPTYNQLIDNPELLIETTAKEDIKYFLHLQLALLFESAKATKTVFESEDGCFVFSIDLDNAIKNVHLPRWVNTLNNQYANKVKFNVDKHIKHIVDSWLNKFTLAHINLSDTNNEEVH